MAQTKSSSSITIGFSTTRLLSSRIIRWITQSSCSHAFIAFDDRSLEMRMVMQAEPWGYELRPWDRWIRDNTLVAEFRPVALRTLSKNCQLQLSLSLLNTVVDRLAFADERIAHA